MLLGSHVFSCYAVLTFYITIIYALDAFTEAALECLKTSLPCLPYIAT